MHLIIFLFRINKRIEKFDISFFAIILYELMVSFINTIYHGCDPLVR